MKMMTSNEIRKAFLDYFHEVGHEMVDSAPLPNYDNPTLLFTNAGMNQFANVFLGKEKRPYSRAVTSQKCMRVSGKHNDLENVGPSQRHHTFFEMLGNFSFGDYFKREAIEYAWTFLTDVIGLDAERLWATIYTNDDEAFELWQRYLPAEKILRFGKKENYWEMGDVGPNGPCSEIHYYRGDLAAIDPSLLNDDNDLSEAFLEVWNLVFMQFETDASGVTRPLPRPSIDTGMGLERITRIVQDVPSNYDSDLFMPAIRRVQTLLGHSDEQFAANTIGYRVIADHGRAATFLIADGVIPGNSGAPYVLRMIIRRAARFGRKIGFSAPFMAEVAQAYIDHMGQAYPDIARRADFIKRMLTQEEERFAQTLDRAELRFAGIVADLRAAGKTQIDGETAFQLHATFGLPLELTRDLAQEIGLTVDEAGFRKAREAHALASGKGAFGQYDISEQIYSAALDELIENGTLGAQGVAYEPYGPPTVAAPIVGLFIDGQIVESAGVGTRLDVVTTRTPFYIEAGGEVSDSGVICTAEGTIAISGMARRAGLIMHLGQVIDGTITVGSEASLEVDVARRSAIRRNHTATHLLHAELRKQLGTHVTQQGSLVAPDRLRFDFSHGEPLASEQLRAIEAAVNAAILANDSVCAEQMAKEAAIAAGAMALFGEKYADVVRTIQIGPSGQTSFELCGGLHVATTGEIGSFFFTAEGSAAAGIRRIEAVTGAGAQQFVAQQIGTLAQAARALNSAPAELPERIDAVLGENRRLQRELEQARRELARAQFESLMSNLHTIAGAGVLVGQVSAISIDGLREMTDWFRNRVTSGVAVLATVQDDKPLLIAAVTDDLVKRGVKAGDLVRGIGQITGGGGGGRPNLAQAGGGDAAKLPQALAAVPEMVAKALG